MTPYRSRTTICSRNMAGAHWLSYATGMNDEDFGKPVIGISNSCNQFVADHVHSRDVGGRFIAQEITEADGVAWEFNTIAVHDGITMGQDSALQPALAIPDRRFGRIHGQRPLRGCAGVRFQLRLDVCAEMKFWWRRDRRLANRCDNG